MRSLPKRVPTALAAGLALLAPLALAPATLPAQSVLGGGDDATVVRRGHARFRVAGIFTNADERFGGPGGDRSRINLGFAATSDTLGAGFLTRFLTPVRDTLRVLGGAADAELSLGRINTTVRTATQTVPLSAEFGILDRLNLSIVVPIVRTRVDVDPRVNAGGTTGTLGFNPALATFGGQGATAAQARNRQLATQLETAVGSLRTLATTCNVPQPTDPRCARFDRARATALEAALQQYRSRVAYVYGDGGSSPGQPFVPLVGSAVQQGVANRLRELSRGLGELGATGLDTTLAPAASATRLGIGGFQRLLTDTTFGIAGDSIRSTRRAGAGDVDLVASFQWLDTFGGDERRRLAPTGLQLRSTVTAGYRFGTGGGDFPDVWFDLPTGAGANALLLRSATDVTVGRRAWASVIVRIAQPTADEVLLRVPESAGQLFAPVSRLATVERTLGRELELELTPRFALTPYVALWGQLRHRSKSADQYRGAIPFDPSTSETIDASVLDAGTDGTEQRVGLGLAYSTLSAYAAGRSTLPIEVSWQYLQTLAGSGGATQRVSGQQLQVRVYFQLLGQRTRNRTGVR